MPWFWVYLLSFLPYFSKPTSSKPFLFSSLGISPSSVISFYRWKELRSRSRILLLSLTSCVLLGPFHNLPQLHLGFLSYWTRITNPTLPLGLCTCYFLCQEHALPLTCLADSSSGLRSDVTSSWKPSLILQVGIRWPLLPLSPLPGTLWWCLLSFVSLYHITRAGV